MMAVRSVEKRYDLSQSKLPVTLGILALLCGMLCLIFVGSHPDIKPRGSVAIEFAEYINSMVLLYEIGTRKKIFALLILFIGFISFWMKAGYPRAKGLSGSLNVQASLINSILVLVTLGFYAYAGSAFLAGSVPYWSAGIAFYYVILKQSRSGLLLTKILYRLSYGSIFIAVSYLIWQIASRLGWMFEPPSLSYIFNYDVMHFTYLLSGSSRLADGYSWFQGVLPTYGVLLPEIAANILRKASFSATSWFIFLQILEVMVVALFLLAAILRSRFPLAIFYMCILLLYYDPAGSFFYFQNHQGWRYIGVAFVLFVMALGSFQNKRVSVLQKAILGVFAFSINFETGIALSAAFAGSEFYSIKNGVSRSIKFAVYLGAILSLVLYLLFSGSITPSGGNVLNFAKVLVSEFGGGLFLAIPALAVIMIHSSLIVWRTARTGIRTATQDFDLVCALYCIFWSMYFINRPDVNYFMSIAIVYACIANRVLADTRWMVSGRKLLAVPVAWCLVFLYAIFPVQQVFSFTQQLQNKVIPLNQWTQIKAMDEVRHSAEELQLNYSNNEGYITPFPFLVRSMSGKANNLSVPDPFAMIFHESEQVAFLHGSLPAAMLLPKVENIFTTVPVPAGYSNYLRRVKENLLAQHYHLSKEMKYWVVYQKDDKTN